MHTDFKLNGNKFKSETDLLAYSKTVSNTVFRFLNQWFDDTKTINVNTSGSTGKPKLIQLKKKQMIHSAIATGAYFELPNKTTALLCLSADYIAGKMMLVRALVLGWHLDIVTPNSNPLTNINKYYDFTALVSIQAYNSLNNLHFIKKIIIGGGVVSQDLLAKLQGISTNVYATYGMTETITHVAVKKLNNWWLQEGVKKQSIYEILPNIKISKDVRGCLVIDAPKLADNKVITNDLVELISDTTFKWLGRYDSVINSGGIKLIPEQIEEKLGEVVKQRFFVVGIPNNELGEKLVLIIESLNNEMTIVMQDKLRNDIVKLQSLSKYEVPKEIYFIEQFVETETKKIQRQQTLNLIFKK